MEVEVRITTGRWINLPDLPVAEKPEEVRWVDDIHKK
jgi:hypothetical protein